MKEELIGLNITVINSKNKSNIGLTGKIIDETKNTITIKIKGSTKKIMKNDVELDIDGKKIEGKKLAVRPEERLKL